MESIWPGFETLPDKYPSPIKPITSRMANRRGDVAFLIQIRPAWTRLRARGGDRLPSGNGRPETLTGTCSRSLPARAER